MRRAFSMIELVIVVVIAGIIAAIAVPRVSGYAARAKERRVVADMGTLQKAAEMFSAEHGGLPVGEQVGGSSVTSGVLQLRMTQRTAYDGTGVGDTVFGPYLRSFPENALNGMATVRVGGAAAGAGTHGWHYDTTAHLFSSDVKFVTSQPDGTFVDYKGTVVTKLQLDEGDAVFEAGGQGLEIVR